MIFLRLAGSRSAAGFKLTRTKKLVGRGPECDVLIPHVSVSRRHAELSVDGVTVAVRDLESRNGTYVDDQRIEECLAGAGQIIRFGGVSFEITNKAVAAHQEIETQSANEPLEVPATEPGVMGISAAERRVLELLLEGLAEKEVARRLKLSRHTVHNHVRKIYRAVNVRSRAELLAQFVPRVDDDKPSP